MSQPDRQRAEERDRLARGAAQALATVQGLDLESAILRGRRLPGLREAPTPSHALVHRHLEALQQQALGELGFERMQARMRRSVVDLLDLVEVLLEPDVIQLVGRVATRRALDGAVLHARVQGGAPLETCAFELEAAGVEEVRLQTVKTLHGYLPRMSLENDGRRHVLTQCPAQLELEPARNLFTGQSISSCSLHQLRARVVQAEGPGEVSQDRP